MGRSLLIVLLLSATAAVLAAQGIITTIAGTEFNYPDFPMRALDTPLNIVLGLASDRRGNLFITDATNNRVLKMDAQGEVTAVAGNGIRGFSGDTGAAVRASLFAPQGVAVDSAGTLYISDGGNNRIRKVGADGIIQTVAGTGVYGFSGDSGIATKAMLAIPSGLALDSAGNLFIADLGNSRIRKLTPAGIISTVAGTGNFIFSGDGGLATAAAIGEVRDVAVDSSGNLFFPDSTHHRIRKVSSNGTITTVAGNGTDGFFGDGGLATAGYLSGPRGVTVDDAGNLYVADYFNNRIRVVSGGIIQTIAGSRLYSFSGDGGPALAALLAHPTKAIVDTQGNIVIADTDNHRVRVVAKNGIINTTAGSGSFRFSGDGAAASGALLNLPSAVGLDTQGNVIVADGGNQRIRRISSDGVISTIGGSGVFGFSGDRGPATAAALFFPAGVTADDSGNVYFADGSGRIRRISTDGRIDTVAGTGALGINGGLNGPAVQADLRAPKSVLFDAQKNLYIGESLGIKKVSPAGIITRVAGSLGTLPGDGGPALAAGIGSVSAMSFDSGGNLYFTDSQNHRVRKITASGIITTLAGTGAAGFSGDGGRAASAQVDSPSGIAIDAIGNVFFCDTSNHRVRRIGIDGILRTIAGTGVGGLSGDGAVATEASLNNPSSLALDAAGNLLVTDQSNHRIRMILANPPQVRLSSTQLQFTASSGGKAPPVQSVGLLGSIPGLGFTLKSDAAWLVVAPANGFSPRLLELTADPAGLKPGDYSANITVTTPNAVPATSTLVARFAVMAAESAKLAVDKQSVSFPFPRDGKARSQTVTVSNAGGGTLTFRAVAQTNNGGNWLAVAPLAGQVLATSPASLVVTANPAGLPPGTYSGTVTISAGSEQQRVPVTMTISSVNQAILLSQTGMSFLGISQGGLVPPQSFGVINIGTGIVNWTVSKSTLSGGPDWLQAQTPSGSSDSAAATVPVVGVTVNASSLPPGKYYGLIQVDAPSAANSPQVVTVFLQVLPAASDLGAAVQPSEILFNAPVGTSPGSENLQVFNLTATPKSFRAAVAADAGLRVAFSPTDGTVDPRAPASITVQPFTDGLAPGVYNATVTLQFSDGRVRTVRLSIAVSNGASKTASVSREAAGDCVPTKLLPALTTLGQAFSVSAGWPVALGVDVRDDCGVPLETGAVSVVFSTGDPPLPLQSLKRGRWEGTWNTQARSIADAVVKLQARDADRNLTGERQISGELLAQTDPPVIERRGIVSAADNEPFVALAPGSIISIYGDRLASGLEVATKSPLPTRLLDTNVLMAGRVLPLYFVNSNQVNAFVPFDLNVNTTYQVYVRRGSTYSQPVSVDVGPAQPGIFRDLSVSANQGFIFAVRNTGDSQVQTEAKPGSPARQGDVITIYCSGLGSVVGSVADGAAAGGAFQTANQLRLIIGGRSATVLYAGLTPGSIGLYQVNGVVPTGVAGDAVLVSITVADQSSVPVVMAVQ